MSSITSPDSILGISNIDSTCININLEKKFNENSNELCGLCFDPLADNNAGINYCCDQNHSSLSCIDCTKSYITNIIFSASNGTCPPIICPMLHNDKKKRVLKYETWKNCVSPEILAKHSTLSSSVLHLLCGGCHNQRSIGVDFCESEIDKYKKNIENAMLSCLSDDNNSDNNINTLFYDDLQQYINGEQTVDEFYNSITSKYLPTMKTGKDKEVLDLFENILKIIIDPERRSLLHLRHLRERPRMWTRCCNRMHCFKCKIKDYHEGNTCSVDKLDGNIIECPSCHTSLVKSEGCNAVSCFCGHNFCWATEKGITDRASAFSKLYPINTSDMCANILCGDDTSLHSSANGWRIRHPIEVNHSLLKWWLQKYSPCPSQACATMEQNKKNSEGVRLALNLWETQNSKEVLKCKTDLKFAQESIFTTFFPIESERALAAVSILKSKRLNHLKTYLVSSDIIKSAAKWVEKNNSSYLNAIEIYSKKLKDNFLYLFGNDNAYKFENIATNVISSPQEWNMNLSNQQLTYTDDNTSVKRTGSVSCYPACFAEIPSIRSRITIVIDEAKQGPNWLSFGVCKKNFPKSNSDGIGRSRDSWGICDDRGKNLNEKAHVSSCGKDVGSCNKLKVNDKLCCIIDTSEGWVEISINDDEFIHTFEIPVGDIEDYLFGMTFANDHKVTIINDQNVPLKDNNINSDHFEMLNHYKKYLKDIFDNKSDLTNSIIDEYALKWDQLYDNDIEASRFAIQTTHSEILNNIIGKKKIDNNINNSLLPIHKNVSWKNLLYAVCYYNKYYDELNIKEQEENSLMFILEHGFESAPFMAAAILCNENEYESNNISFKRAKDYMKLNNFAMNEWYEYNMNSSEPLLGLERVDKNCFCLPRHTSKCPNPNENLALNRLNEKKLLKIALEKESGLKKKELNINMLNSNNNEEFGIAELFDIEGIKKPKRPHRKKNNKVKEPAVVNRKSARSLVHSLDA